MTTHARRIHKLEAQVVSLRARLDARTTQLLLVLTQINDLKDALDAAGLEITTPDLTEEPPTWPSN